jgi:hypothetical protein
LEPRFSDDENMAGKNGKDNGKDNGEDRSVATLNVFDLAQELKTLGAEAFRTRYPHPFLVVRYSPPDDSEEVEIQTVETQLQDFSPDKERRPIIKVIPLIKSDRNAFKSKILLGRAKNNDVVLRASKVSKVHAAFVVGKDEWQLMDMGSVNGTLVNGERLEKNQSVPLKNGEMITLWRYVFEYYDLESFTEILRKFSKRKEPLLSPPAGDSKS